MAQASYAQQLNTALYLVSMKHAEQVDKGGHPYALHLMRVASVQPTIVGVIVGWLHDIVEDTDVTLDDLRDAGLDENVVRAVDAMSRREKESVSAYIGRVMSNPIAIHVKLADLRDNIRPERLDEVGEKEARMLQLQTALYRKLFSFVNGDAPKGSMAW